MRRREFIKLSSLLAAGAAVTPGFLLGGCAAKPLPGTGAVTSTPTICDMCFWKCAGNIYKEEGELWKITGNENDLHSGGRLCTRGTGGPGAYLDPDRLKTPLMRVTVDGQQTFRPVSWDEALNFISERMRAIADEHGPEKLLMMSHGAGSSHFHHLLRAYGSQSTAEPSFAQCRGPRDVGFRLTFGESVSSPERTDMANADCIVLLGSHIGENLHNAQVQTLAEALNRDVTLITVDPRFSVPAGKSKHWLPIRPGTDLALLLSWMYVLIDEDLYDHDYVERHTVGFEQLKDHVRAYTPEWVYLETGIRPEVIRETAREMGKAAPATIVHPGRHATWYGDDTQRSRAIAMLNALLGSWNRKGGFYIPEKVSLPDYPLPPYPEPKHTVADAYPGKWPFASQGVTNGVIDASIGEDAFFKGWLIYGTNLPQTIPAVEERLAAAANSLDLVVVVDTMPSEITGYADVVLPECTYLERYDELRNSGERAPSLALRMPAFEPHYESKPGWWIAKQLGERLGLQDYFPWNDFSEKLDWQLQQVGSSLEEMQRIGVKNFPRSTPLYFEEGRPVAFRTPSRKIELYSRQLAEAGFDPMPVYTPPDPVPKNFYRLNYGRMPAHTFGKTTNNPLLYQLAPENQLWVNPLVASEWDLKSGDYVRLGSTAGAVSNRIRVRVTERIGPDSVFMAHGFGHKSKKLRLTAGLGADDSALMNNVKIDPIMGGTGMRGNFVTFVLERDPGSQRMTRYAMVIDTVTCIGCGDCVVACKTENKVPEGLNRDWVVEATSGTYPDLHTEFRSERCNHCSNPTCVTLCPTGASHLWDDSNIVLVDADKCTGCKACIAACPYDARLVMHPDGYIDKCTFCHHRVARGEDPACVSSCPTRCMHFGLLDDPGSTVSELLRTRRYKVLSPETGNEPNVYYLL